MINNKLEKICLVVFFVLLCIPVPNDMPIYFKNLLYFVILIVSIIMYNIYIKLRNKIFMKKINKQVVNHSYKTAIAIYDKAIKHQPKLYWLQINRTILQGLNGDFFNFYTNFNNYIQNENFIIQPVFATLVIVKDVINILLGHEYDFTSKQIVSNSIYKNYISTNDLNLHLTCETYITNNNEEAIKYAELLLDSQNNAFSSYFASFILSKVYEKNNNNNLAKKYKDMLQDNPLYNNFFESDNNNYSNIDIKQYYTKLNVGVSKNKKLKKRLCWVIIVIIILNIVVAVASPYVGQVMNDLAYSTSEYYEGVTDFQTYQQDYEIAANIAYKYYLTNSHKDLYFFIGASENIYSYSAFDKNLRWAKLSLTEKEQMSLKNICENSFITSNIIYVMVEENRVAFKKDDDYSLVYSLDGTEPQFVNSRDEIQTVSYKKLVDNWYEGRIER